MTLGSSDRGKLTLAGGLLLVAFVLIGWRSFSGSPSLRVLQKKSSWANGGPGKKGGKDIPLDPTLRLEGLRATESLRYAGFGRDIFRVVVEQRKLEITPERETRLPDAAKVALPPIPLRFFGFSRKAGVSAVFLSKGDDIFIANEGDIVDRRYRIVKVTPEAVDVEDLLNEQRQRLWLRRG